MRDAFRSHTVELSTGELETRWWGTDRQMRDLPDGKYQVLGNRETLIVEGERVLNEVEFLVRRVD